jgi:trans-aconitate 2-methyltransferase
MKMRSFQWNAIDYARSSSIQQEWARELIRKLDLKGNESLLDIGSGDGKVSAEIASHLPRGSVLGIDNSQEMVNLAQKLFPADAFVNLQFQVKDACDLDFGNRFDVVFSNATLHWIMTHGPLLKGINKCLKPGGRILLQMGGRGNAGDVMKEMDGLITGEKWKGFFKGFGFKYGFHGTDEYRQWLKEAILVPVRVELIPKDAQHKGRSAFESWIRTTWLPYTHQIPEDRRESFIKDLADCYLEKYPADNEDVIHVKMVRLEVEAVKN